MKTVAGKVFLRDEGKSVHCSSIEHWEGDSPNNPLEQTSQGESESTEEVECSDEGDSGPARRPRPSHQESGERRQAE